MEDLEELWTFGDEETRRVIESCSRALADESRRRVDQGLEPHAVGDVLEWILEPESRPSPEELHVAPVSYPLIFLTQAARLVSLEALGLAPHRIAHWATAVTGHSQGIIAAWLAAQGHDRETLRLRAAALTGLMHRVGVRKQEAWGHGACSEPTMTEVTGLDRVEIDNAIYGLDELVCQIHNGPKRYVVAGPPGQIGQLRRRLELLRDLRPDAQRLNAAPLPCSAPFHSKFMSSAVEPLEDDARRLDIDLSDVGLVVPLLGYEDGSPWRGAPGLIESLCVGKLDWPATLQAACELDVTHIVDLGPHDGMAKLASSIVAGKGVFVVPAATRDGLALLSSVRDADISPPEPWSRRAPRAVTTAEGKLATVNAFTRYTGSPPVLFQGSRQRSDEPAEERPHERYRRNRLDDLLSPVLGKTFRARGLDPSHLVRSSSADEIGRKLDQEGCHLLGVTLNLDRRGPEETVGLVNALNGYKPKLCALAIEKDVDVVKALQTADLLPDTILTLQFDFDGRSPSGCIAARGDLLLQWYPKIRARKNVLLAVLGRAGLLDRVEELLTGLWSAAEGYPPMPVDAVMLDIEEVVTASRMGSRPYDDSSFVST